MVNVIQSVFVSSKCPKYLQPIAKELQKSQNYAFEEDEQVVHLAQGYQKWVEDYNVKHPASNLTFRHIETSEGGSFSFFKNDGPNHFLLRMVYFHLLGHVSVSADHLHLYKTAFINFDAEKGDAACSE